MLSFRCPEDLAKLPPDDPAHPIIKELIDDLIEAYTWEDHPYDTENYSYIIRIEEV